MIRFWPLGGATLISGSATSDAPTRRPFAIHTDILLERRSRSNVGRGKEIPTCLVVVLVIGLPLGGHIPIDLIDFANLKCTSVAHRREDLRVGMSGAESFSMRSRNTRPG